MSELKNVANFELIYVIVNYGMGSRVLQTAKKLGLSGGTVVIGKGTVNHSILNFLSLYDEQKEIVILGTNYQSTEKTLADLNHVFNFEKRNQGIVFTTGVGKIIGSSFYNNEKTDEESGVRKSMYQLIITIVNRGNAGAVIDAAKAAGSKGGTIINARGSGIHETQRLFNMDIEPEKEMVLILSKEDITNSIVDSIRVALEIDQPGNGIIFIQDVNQTYGIYE
ncbi:P-II family nitrogen regulator [Amphibacillus indicireducens]|uniref:P-II family nitrogen regulator n=1 Tax=Amphibacillus indicireducens TaxID=1076330 RepID=A0ABP7VAB2_9BACI